MTTRNFVPAIVAAALAAACAPQPPAAPEEAPPPVASAAPAPAAKAAAIAPLTLEGYKKTVADRVAASSKDLYSDPVPEMLKSIVVLNITIDRNGNLAHVSVRRSNGFRQLENRAMESVRRAAPYPAPTWLARHGEDSVSFLETFLFRDDGRFQIRTLVAAR